MDEGFVRAVQVAFAAPHVKTIGEEERLIVPSGWTEIPRKFAQVAALKVGTLTGLVDYVRANVDALALPELLVHVEAPGVVKLVAKLEDETLAYRRHCYLEASTALTSIKPYPFGDFLDVESAIIALQSLIVQSKERDDLLLLVASIRESNVRETTDDHVAQHVSVQQGIRLVGMTEAPNPVTLAPYRTFREVEQPASRFVLRLRSGREGDKPSVALFEADGGAWKLEAIQRVAAFLREALPTMQVIA